MFHSSKTYMLALAALLCLLIGTLAAPTDLQPRLEPDGTLFPKGGVELSHIAIRKSGEEPRSEKATIFSQGLIVTRKLNKGWLPLYFEDYDGESEVKSEETKVKPFYDTYGGDEPEVIPIVRNQGLMDAALSGVDDMTFGVSEPTPWWPYAVFSGVTKAGWGRKDGEDLKGVNLVVQTLELLTGFSAIAWPTGTLKEDLIRQVLDLKANETPFIIQIKPFDASKHEDLKGLRWEEWVSVMSYDDTTKEIKFATSFYDGDDGVTQTAKINDLEIVQIVQLLDSNKLEKVRPVKEAPSSTEGLNLPDPTGASI